MAKRIFILEDDIPTADVYRTAFGLAKFDIEIVGLGREAIKKVKEMGKKKPKPDLFLLDLILPDISGLEVLKEIRAQKETKDVPLFILTNYTDQELEKMGYKLKTERFLLKADYVPRELVKIIKKRLKV